MRKRDEMASLPESIESSDRAGYHPKQTTKALDAAEEILAGCT